MMFYEGLHYYKPQAQKIEHTNQNKVRCKLFCFGFKNKNKNCFESLYSKMLPFD